MTRRTRRLLLWLVAAVCAVFLAILLSNRELLLDARRPAGLDPSARWLAEHPADWIAASAVVDGALDSDRDTRFALWRRAYGHARHLAPLRRNADAGFVRAGLFHWHELGPGDRARVREVSVRLLRDPALFARLLVPLWRLMRDFAFLRANAPDTVSARLALRDLAVTGGLFAEYRIVREEIRAQRMKTLAQMRRDTDPLPLLELVPDRLTAADEPLARGILEELDRKAFDPSQVSPRIETLVDYAVRHDLRPLTGLAPLLDVQGRLRDVTRARAALDLGDAKLATRIETAAATTASPEWEPYLIDRALFEARAGNASLADGFLVRATTRGMTLPLLAAAEQVATLLGDAPARAGYRRALEARARAGTWSADCGPKELCSAASRDAYTFGEAISIQLTTTQSDEIAPYVEVSVDDRLVAEGDVPDLRTFTVAATPGLHRIEVRVVNPRTRNGAQRRLTVE